MQIPFTKAHGAKNDFLLTWTKETPPGTDLPAVARAICDRNTGVGADGWLLVDERPGIRLFNSDGSEPELSGNGTRCAAAFLIAHNKAALADSGEMQIATGAGPKKLKCTSRRGLAFDFEMNMGRPAVLELHHALDLAQGSRDVTLVDCGNPQCVVVVPNFDFDWIALGTEIEHHPYFPHRTNVSFVQKVNPHTIAAVFYERGAGATMSSGTGATGAAVCAMARKLATSPVTVLTTAGPLEIEDRGDVYLSGPAVIVAKGTYHYDHL